MTHRASSPQNRALDEDEVMATIHNYEVMMNAMKTYDAKYESIFAHSLVNVLHNECISPLKKAIGKVWQQEKTLVERVENLTKEFGIHNERGIDESPLVLLLYLAIETNALLMSRTAFSMEKKDFSVDEKDGSEEDCGRFSAISQYFKTLEFKTVQDQNGKDYWPGLPSCLMGFFPTSTSDPELQMSICASVDKFERIRLLKGHHENLRKQRIRVLRRGCDSDTQIENH